MSNLCTPIGDPSPKKNLGAKFFTLRVRGVVQTFPSNRPWKGVSKTFKNFGGSPKHLRGVTVSPNFVVFRLFRSFLRNGARYHQSENELSNYGQFPTSWCKNGLLCSTTKYVIAAHSHPPCGRRYSDSTKQRRINLLVIFWITQSKLNRC